MLDFKSEMRNEKGWIFEGTHHKCIGEQNKKGGAFYLCNIQTVGTYSKA